MKRLLLLLPLIAVVWYFASSHAHQRAMAPYLVVEPQPALSAVDVSSDLPADAQFNQAGWKTVTDVQAEAFSYLDQDHRCNTAWRNTVLDRKPDARIEASDAMGQKGLVVWHRMRIIEADGTRSAMMQRPGPRISGQTTD